MSFSRPVGQLLRAAVATPARDRSPDELLAGTRGDRLRGLARAATFHGIVGHVAAAVEASPAGQSVAASERRALREVTDHLAARHAAVVSNLRHLGTVFDILDTPWVVVKGPVLAEPVHGAGHLRAYGDLDVIVPADSFGAVLDGFEQGGAQVLAGDWRRRLDARAGEVPVRLPSGLLVDLHWHLINSGTVRDHFRIPMTELLERRVTVEVGGVEVATLDPADTLAHVALHTALAGSNRLVWLKDVERLVARYGQDVLGQAAARAARWGGSLAMADVMGRVGRVLGLPPEIHWTPAPDPGTRVWLAMSAGAERMSPVERQDGGPSILRIVSRAVREDVPSSARVLAGKVVRRGAEMVSGPPEEHAVDGDGSARSAARTQYLTAVARMSDDGAPRNDL